MAAEIKIGIYIAPITPLWSRKVVGGFELSHLSRNVLRVPYC
jgi:hypothetical protein